MARCFTPDPAPASFVCCFGDGGKEARRERVKGAMIPRSTPAPSRTSVEMLLPNLLKIASTDGLLERQRLERGLQRCSRQLWEWIFSVPPQNGKALCQPRLYRGTRLTGEICNWLGLVVVEWLP